MIKIGELIFFRIEYGETCATIGCAQQDVGHPFATATVTRIAYYDGPEHDVTVTEVEAV